MATNLPNSIFIHTPKTAGVWATAMLQNLPIKSNRYGKIHSTSQEIKDITLSGLKKPCWGFVRHPLTWYQSYWSHRMLECWEPIVSTLSYSYNLLGFLNLHTAETADSNFNMHIRRMHTYYPYGFLSTLFAEYVFGCDKICRFENLYSDFADALSVWENIDRSELPIVQPLNIIGALREDHYYSDESLNMVMEMEKETIKRFNYDYIPDDLRRL